MICMTALLNLESTTSSPPNKNNDRERKMLYRTCASTKNLSFLTCQTRSFKSRKISLRKVFSDKSLSKIPSETLTQHQKNASSTEK